MGSVIEVSKSFSRMPPNPLNSLVFPGAPKYNLGQYPQVQGISISEERFDKNIKRILPADQYPLINTDEGHFLKICNAESQENDTKIIYFHGNAQNARQSLQIALPIFRRLQTTIFVMEYPGYGNYQNYNGDFLDRLKSDCKDFHQSIKNQYEIEDSDICIIGRSIGTGVASYLSSQNIQCQRLLLISPFDSIKQMGNKIIGLNFFNKSFGIGNILAMGQFDNVKTIQNYKGDLMIIHGENDEVIRISHAQNLVKEYKKTHFGKKYDFMKVSYMGHNNIQMTKEILDDIKNFLIEGAQKGEYEIQI